MNLIRVFHVLLVALVVGHLLQVFGISFGGHSESIRHLVSYAGYEGVLNAKSPLLLGILLPLPVVCAVGLFFFQNWARYLFLATNILYLLALLFGVSVSAPPVTLFSYLTALANGAILSLAFLSPGDSWFRRRQ